MILCETIIPRGVIRMEDLEKLKVAQSNDFIKGVSKMDKIPLKIFELAVSALDSKKPPNDNTVYIDKEVLYSFFKADDADRSPRFKHYIDKLFEQSNFEIRTKLGNRINTKKFSGVSSAEWNNIDNIVSVRFTDEIMEFLVDLQEGNFTQYNISAIAKMERKHSITIYKWLVMHYNQFSYYEFSSTRNRNQKEMLKNPQIDVHELRIMTDTIDKYKEFTDFEKRVLKEPILEINEYTNLNVTYEKIKKGRNINSIKFFITEKPIKKAEVLDEEYLNKRLTKEEREKELNDKRDKALDSDYTALLMEYHIIKFADLKNKNMLATFYDYLYPEYDKLEQLKSRNEKLGLKDHLRYMQNELSKKSEQPNNLLRYLKVSAENYVNRIKSEGL